MEKPVHIFHKKIIKKRSLKARHRDTMHKKNTKAELKKEFLTNCQKAIEHIKVFNRILMVNEKINHLSVAITYLEKCLVYRPGNHLFRNQIKICREELFTLKESKKRSSNNMVGILLSMDLF